MSFKDAHPPPNVGQTRLHLQASIFFKAISVIAATIKSLPHDQHLGAFIRRSRSWEFSLLLFQGPHPLPFPSPGGITRFSQLAQPQKFPGIPPPPIVVSSPASWEGNL